MNPIPKHCSFGRLRVVVVLETVSVLMQAVVVFALGVVGASGSLQCWSLGSPSSFLVSFQGLGRA